MCNDPCWSDELFNRDCSSRAAGHSESQPKELVEDLQVSELRSVNQSISVILPIRNAQSTLPQQVSTMLDVLPDLASHFELILVDDASTDRTEEVALDLTRTYPQVRFFRHNDSRGNRAAVRTGMEHATSDVVLVKRYPDTETLGTGRVLQKPLEGPLSTARPPADDPETMNPALLRRLTKWSAALQQEQASRP